MFRNSLCNFLFIISVVFVSDMRANDKAIQYFKKAVNTGNATPLQILYLSRALIDGGHSDRAKRYLARLVKLEPRSDNYIEDLNYIIEAKALWDTYFKEGVEVPRTANQLGKPN